MKNFALLLFTAIISSLCTVAFFKYFDSKEKIIIRERVPDSQLTSIEDQLFQPSVKRNIPNSNTDFTNAASDAIKAVVHIRSIYDESDTYYKRSFKSSSGSGVIVSPNGYIITNYHVIDNSDRLSVSLNNKKEYDAEIVGVDPNTDLALIKIEKDDLPFLPFGNSDELQVGEWVIAVGNPFRLESTVTAGIVSAKSRQIDILESEQSVEAFIQTDAVVNQGNSGGALVNVHGELVGINSAIITQTGRYEGYSFAIPSNLAQKIMYDLNNYGKVQRGLLGVRIMNLNNEVADNLDLNNLDGALVTGVSPASSADRAGIRKDDVIISIDDESIKSFPELQEKVARRRPGDSLAVGIIRRGEKSVINVLLDKSHSTDYTLTKLGFELRDLTNSELNRFEQSGSSVKAIYKDSKIAETKMGLHFVITSVNGKAVRNSDEVVSQIKNSKFPKISLSGFYPDVEGDYTYQFYKD